MTNAQKFKDTFNGMFATELWALPEENFLEWLNAPVADATEVRHGRWIPCSERMPDKSGTYLASTNMGDVGLAECDWDYEDGMYWSAEYLDVDGIVAWMPLPEPYREDKE